jgi:cyclopropane-fatty-acyl-phospholipid synthase
MTSSFDESGARAGAADAAVGRLRGLAGFFARKILRRLEVGALVIELPSGSRLRHSGRKPGPLAKIKLHNWRLLRRLALHGDIGLAHAYIDRDWSSPDLTALFELGVANSAPMMDAVSGSAPFRAFNWLAHRFRANTRRGSRRNIEAHYDLGNEFYRLWLGPSMMYSSALYRSQDLTLEEAQSAKIQRIAAMLDIPPNEASVLEIGCGWGALSASIAARGGARVTGVTISPSQLEWAEQLARERKVDDRVDLRLQDYRDVEGRFDRIVSVEMIEAVGREFIPRYFETIRNKLEPGGRCVLQAITIAEDRFAAYCRRPDFIQRFIFPGGFLPTRTLMQQAIERASLKLTAVETFGESYALTLREWRKRFHGAWPQIEGLGFKPSFRRLWDYYLCYCEAGFLSGAVDVGLYTVTHADG